MKARARGDRCVASQAKPGPEKFVLYQITYYYDTQHGLSRREREAFYLPCLTLPVVVRPALRSLYVRICYNSLNDNFLFNLAIRLASGTNVSNLTFKILRGTMG